MIFNYRNKLVILFSVLGFLFSCKEDEPEVRLPDLSNQYQIIKSISPTSGKRDVSIYSALTADFGFILDKAIMVEGVYLKPVLKEFKVFKGDIEIPGQVGELYDKNKVDFTPSSTLPSDASLKIVIKAQWERQHDGEWVAVSTNGESLVEIKESLFSTAPFQLPGEIFSTSLPLDKSIGQSVLTHPVVVFKNKIEKPLIHENREFRPIIDEWHFMKGTEEIAYNANWSSEKDSLKFNPNAILEGSASYTLFIKAHWEEKSNGNWQLLMNGDEIPYLTHQFSFTTQTLVNPNEIIKENISFSYPIPEQLYFLKDESPEGYLQLKYDFQDVLFETKVGSVTWELMARFSTPGSNVIQVPLHFEKQSRFISYDIPASLENEKIYLLEFVKVPKSQLDAAEVIVYKTYFRTSKYDTFVQKWNAVQFGSGFRSNLYPFVDELVKSANALEPFDAAEISSETFSGFNRLIDFEADFSDNEWFNHSIYPLIYKDLAGSGLSLDRDVSILGVIPARGIFIRQYPGSLKLTPEEIAGHSIDRGNVNAGVVFNVVHFVYEDFEDLRKKASEHKKSGTANAYMTKLLDTIFPRIGKGEYKYKVRYVLPGKNQPSSELKDSIVNPV